MQNCHPRRGWSSSEGFSLVEVLAGVGLTTMVAVVITSLLLAVMASERRLLQDTDVYDSMRLPAAMIVQDARFALWPECGWNFLKLYINLSDDHYLYKFEDGNGKTDPNHLHRMIVLGGTVQRDDIVGWNLVPPVKNSGVGTAFGCTYEDEHKTAKLTVVKAPLSGQSAGMRLKVMAYLRSH